MIIGLEDHAHIRTRGTDEAMDIQAFRPIAVCGEASARESIEVPMGRTPMAAALAVTIMISQAVGGPVFADAGPARPNWGTERSELISGADYDKSKGICRALGVPVAPAGDMPTPAQRAALGECRSEPLYYGEGKAVDYDAARLCAFGEAQGADDQTFGGSTILMQIYANGLGVPRNLDLATAYACQLQGAPAESDARVLHLQALKAPPGEAKADGRPVEPFDYCNDVTSGWAGSECEARDSTLASFARDAKVAALEAHIPQTARSSYHRLREALEAFIEMHADGEVDQTGSGRAGFVIEEQDAVRDQFVSDLELLLSGDWPVAGATAARDAVAHLNASYRRILAWAASGANMSTIHPDAIRNTQRAWLVYRDAFKRFAAAASPGTGRDALLARLTNLRNAQLDRMPV